MFKNNFGIRNLWKFHDSVKIQKKTLKIFDKKNTWMVFAVFKPVYVKYENI